MRLITVMLVALFSGCAGNLYMDMAEDDFRGLQMTEAVDVVYQGTPFWLQTTETVVSGGLLPDAINRQTGAAEIPSGGAIVRRYNVTPPIEDIKRYVVDNFNSGLGMSVAEFKSVEVPLNEDLDAVFQQKARGEGYALKLENTQWFSSYTTFDWNTQIFSISASAELVRKSDGKTIWKGFCNANGNEDPSMKMETKNLITDDAQQLKSILKHGAEVCAQELLTQIKQGPPKG